MTIVCSAMRAVVLMLAIAAVCVRADTPCSKVLKITDDDNLAGVISKARSLFLASRPHPFDRLDATILLPQADGSFLRGSYNGNNVAYPASTVKLAYLVGAIQWCGEQSLPYSCLEAHVRGMITISSNFETGVIVDVTSGVVNQNYNVVNATFLAWLDKRRYTAKFLDSRGLLENQTILHKTTPTNSGPDPVGAEALARTYAGMNAMCPKCAASLMGEIVTGQLHSQARDYMLQLLAHQPWNGFTSFGYGLPPGSLIYAKLGNAYDTLEEISHVVLPNGKSFIMAAYSNGFEPSEPGDYSISGLGRFAELVVELAGLDAGLPPKLVLDTAWSGFSTVGAGWRSATARDMFGSSFQINTAVGDMKRYAQWSFAVPETGIYEVCVWAPEFSAQARDVPALLLHADGNATFSLDQTHYGGRWVKLGDYNFNAGQNGRFLIYTGTRESQATTAANAIKLTRWPDCNGVPGTFCNYSGQR